MSVNSSVRKYDPIFKTIDDATHRLFSLDIVNIIHGYASTDRKQLSKEVITQHTYHIQKREQSTYYNSKTIHRFVQQCLSYIREIKRMNMTRKSRHRRTRVLRLSYKLFDLLIDMKYLYTKSTNFIDIIKGRLTSFYYKKPYCLNFAHYHRILFKDNLEVTQNIKQYIEANKQRFDNPLTKYKVKNKLCSMCKQIGHNKRSCHRWNAIPTI